jgi:hypothetical protein
MIGAAGSGTRVSVWQDRKNQVGLSFTLVFLILWDRVLLDETENVKPRIGWVGKFGARG